MFRCHQRLEAQPIQSWQLLQASNTADELCTISDHRRRPVTAPSVILSQRTTHIVCVRVSTYGGDECVKRERSVLLEILFRWLERSGPGLILKTVQVW